MAGSGSILGNAVLRLEDPTLLTGEGKYVDDMVEPGMLHVSFVRSTVAHGNVVSVDVSEAASMPGVVGVYHAGGDDLGLPSFQGFPMMPAALNRPIFATRQGALRRRHRRRRGRRDQVAGRRRGRGRDRRVRAAAGGHQPDGRPGCRRAAAVPRARLQRLLRHRARPGRRSARGRRRRRRGHHGQPAPRRRADGEQRRRRRTRPTVGSPCGCRTRRPHSIHGAYAPMLGLEPAKLRVVCPWVGGGFGPKAAGYVEHLVAAKVALDAEPSGQVGRDPLRGHGVARARPRLRDDRQARRHQGRQDRRPRRQRGRRRPVPTRRSAPSCRCSPR